MKYHFIKAFLIIAALFSLPAIAEQPVILVMGDSLSAGYGLDQNQEWPHLLQLRLTERRYPYQVVNASISGETSEGGLTRLSARLNAHHPAIVIIELGANDGLRGLSLKAMGKNLAAIIEKSQASGARVILIGMQLPPNYGPVYTRTFSRIFRDLASQYHTQQVPFLMAGFATDRTRFQSDGFHPSAEAQPLMLDTIWQALEPLLKRPPTAP